VADLALVYSSLMSVLLESVRYTRFLYSWLYSCVVLFSAALRCRLLMNCRPMIVIAACVGN